MTRDYAPLKKQLEDEEARVPYAYQDQFGLWTIAIGRLVDKKKGGHLRNSEMDFMLDNDVKEIELEVLHDYPWAVRLSQPRLDALLQMRFQLGKLGLSRFANFLGRMEDGVWDQAASEIDNSIWAHQTPDRAHRLAKQILTDMYQFKA